MANTKARTFALLMAFLLLFTALGHAEANDSTGSAKTGFTDEELAKYTTLSIGSKGDAVAKLKMRLYELGYYNTSNLNNSFTKNTSEYVKAFQEMNSLPADGVATPLVQATMFSDKAIPKESYSTNSKSSFTLRNGISWGMHYDEIKALTDLEFLGEPTKDNGSLHLLKYEKAPVANMYFNMYMLILDDDFLGTEKGANYGLMALFYIIPGYTALASNRMNDDYDSLIDLLTAKYGKPSYKQDQWEDDIKKTLFSEKQGASLGFFTRTREWKSDETIIGLFLNSDIATSMELDDVSTPTISICYYSQIFMDLIQNDKEAGPNTSGL